EDLGPALAVVGVRRGGDVVLVDPRAARLDGGGEPPGIPERARLGGEPLASDRGLFELASDRGGEALQVVLEAVVTGACAHGLDGALLTDGPGDEDEGDVRGQRLDQLDRK